MVSPALRIVLLSAAAFALCGCLRLSDPPSIVVAGATLLDGSSRPPVADAVLVVTGEKIAAMGSQASTPVPTESTKFDGRGKFIFPLTTTDQLKVGGAASFLLLSVNPAQEPEFEKHIVGRMVGGRWTVYPQ